MSLPESIEGWLVALEPTPFANAARDIRAEVAALQGQRDEARRLLGGQHAATGCSSMHTGLAAEAACARDAILANVKNVEDLQRERDDAREVGARLAESCARFEAQVSRAEEERDRAENELAVERSCKYDAELARDTAAGQVASLTADNAALVKLLTRAERSWAASHDLNNAEHHAAMMGLRRAITTQPNPGAALLEQLKRLEDTDGIAEAFCRHAPRTIFTSAQIGVALRGVIEWVKTGR